ncbi:MAG TPA: MqnA/MqnD/SBP family protein [Candidatus Acidoferrales bacterium]|nr:MqnA/MqnD/SBP family protein [Candidatus Acidoferrales bacterium]
MNAAAVRIIRFGHSPDADDAFMFYGLAKEIVRIPGYRVEHVMQDIQSLNERARSLADLEVTAISTAVYPEIASRYRIMSSGASMGRGYGPQVVSLKLASASELSGKRLAIPGAHTTAFLVLRLYLGDNAKSVEFAPVNFDQIPQAILDGRVDAGLLIHEGQLTHPEMGLHEIVDLGKWWDDETGLPLPLGLDVVRRDLGEELSAQINSALRRSIEVAYADEENALDYALSFGRGIEREVCRAFVKMYVNRDTLDMGESGRRSLEELFARAATAGLVPKMPPLDIVAAESRPG